MRISVVPRIYFELRRATVGEDIFVRSNIISINTPSRKEEPPFPAHFWNAPNLLCLAFDDVADPEREKGIFMAEEDVDRVYDFTSRIDRSLPLFIHCTAGISRSGAVGEVLDRLYNCHLEEHHEDHTMFLRRHRNLVPNRWVRHIMLQGVKKHFPPQLCVV